MKVSATRHSPADLLDLAAAAWGEVPATRIPLQGTLLGLQPTAAVRNGWQHRAIGAIHAVEARAAIAGDSLFFHLRWADAAPNHDHGDNTVFPDAAAIALPLHPDAPLITMGAPAMPLTAWFWRADSGAQGYEVRAEGPGTTRITGRDVQARAAWRDGAWQLVLARTLAGAGNADSIALAPGQTTRFGIAVWEGSHQERGGLKAFSGEWRELVLEQLRPA